MPRSVRAGRGISSLPSRLSVMFDADLEREFNRYRGAQPGTTLCPAPLVNLHFSQLGVVTACCFNRTHVLGVYPRDSIQEIWEGAAALELREALARGDLSKGCEKCLQQIVARDFGGSHAVFYTRHAAVMSQRREALDRVPPGNGSGAPWPLKMEFNVHNACNLQCVMCHGLASSSIRTLREGLGPMPNPYDDAFVDQLEPYLPYVVETDFMGGEPFLVPVYQRIWELIGRVNPQAKVCILTNATILDHRIKAALERINCWLHVSIDSFRKDTYEIIRRGASYDEVMANVEYFRELMTVRGLPLVWRLCPMRLNWRELPDTVRYCSERGFGLFYNQVDSPVGLSLHTLPVNELARVVDALEAQEPEVPQTPIGVENLQNYRDLVARLRGFLRPENRLNGLRARLETSRAVVEQYSGRKERAVRRPEAPASKDDDLTQAVKEFLITRLNVAQADAADSGIPAEFREALETTRRILIGFQDQVSYSRFLATYLKEVIRTYSGVWGVTEVHGRDVFGRVDELAAMYETGAVGGRDDGWTRLVEPPLREVYEAVGLAPSVDAMREWLASL